MLLLPELARSMSRFGSALVLAFAIGPAAQTLAQSPQATRPGEFVIEAPTHHALGFRWYIDGDANRNAVIATKYRPAGETVWLEALPLLRIGREEVDKNGPDNWRTPDMFAGSILNLQPGTEYEVKLELADPDGGRALRTERIQTRPVPRAPSGGQTFHLYPSDQAGGRIEPAYTDLQQAWAAAGPGDTILVHKGVHRPEQSDLKERPIWKLVGGGTVERPVVIRGESLSAVLDGRAATTMIDMQEARFVHLADLTLRDADHLLYIGRERFGTDIDVIGCRFEQSQFPVFAIHPGNRNLTVIDNYFIGPRPNWHPRVTENNESHAIWLSGCGHDIGHNRIHGFWDGVTLFGGRPVTDRSLQNAAIDIHHNDISEISDDAIEMDYGVHNLRVHHNRITNVFSGISAQPLYGGPGYIFRNEVYNSTRSPLKLNRRPAGLFIANNSFVSWGSAGRWEVGWQNTRIYNNLFFGTDGGPGIIWTGTGTPTTSEMDYNGWHHFTPGEPFLFWWKFPRPVRVPTANALADESGFTSWDRFREWTDLERHGLIVDYGEFVDAQEPSGRDGFLAPVDLQIRPNSRAVDRGRILPTITDGFRGAAPDLGAHEQGFRIPEYGPRKRSPRERAETNDRMRQSTYGAGGRFN